MSFSNSAFSSIGEEPVQRQTVVASPDRYVSTRAGLAHLQLADRLACGHGHGVAHAVHIDIGRAAAAAPPPTFPAQKRYRCSTPPRPRGSYSRWPPPARRPHGRARDAASSASSWRTMYCTCSLSAEPSPTTASFIWLGEYSPTASPHLGAGHERRAARLARGEGGCARSRRTTPSRCPRRWDGTARSRPPSGGGSSAGARPGACRPAWPRSRRPRTPAAARAAPPRPSPCGPGPGRSPVTMRGSCQPKDIASLSQVRLFWTYVCFTQEKYYLAGRSDSFLEPQTVHPASRNTSLAKYSSLRQRRSATPS